MSMNEYIVSTYIWSVYTTSLGRQDHPIKSLHDKHGKQAFTLLRLSLSEDIMMHIPSEKQNFPILM